MADEIQPALTATVPAALTADEWAEYLDPENAAWVLVVYHDKGPHAAAATALYGQPYGFDDLSALGDPVTTFVEALRDTADAIDTACGTTLIGAVHVEGPGGRDAIAAHYADMFRELAARIAALLPPDPKV